MKRIVSLVLVFVFIFNLSALVFANETEVYGQNEKQGVKNAPIVAAITYPILVQVVGVDDDGYQLGGWYRLKSSSEFTALKRRIILSCGSNGFAWVCDEYGNVIWEYYGS